MVASVLRQQWSNNRFSSAFVEFFDSPSHFISPEAEKLPSYIDIEPLSPENGPIIAKPLKNLIDYQTQVYVDANKALEIPRSRFIIQMPTGSGKLAHPWRLSQIISRKHRLVLLWYGLLIRANCVNKRTSVSSKCGNTWLTSPSRR